MMHSFLRKHTICGKISVKTYILWSPGKALMFHHSLLPLHSGDCKATVRGVVTMLKGKDYTSLGKGIKGLCRCGIKMRMSVTLAFFFYI